MEYWSILSQGRRVQKEEKEKSLQWKRPFQSIGTRKQILLPLKRDGTKPKGSLLGWTFFSQIISSVQVRCTIVAKVINLWSPTDPLSLFFPPFQTGRCGLAVTDLPLITINPLLFLPNEPCFRCRLLIDWWCSPGDHLDGSFVLFFSREFTQSSGKNKEKTYRTYSAASLGWYTTLSFNQISQHIRIKGKQKEEWHVFYFMFFSAPLVAYLTLEGNTVNKSLRTVYIWGLLSAPSRKKKKKKKLWGLKCAQTSWST